MPEGPEGLPEGLEGLSEGPTGLPGGPGREMDVQMDVWKFSPFYRTVP